MVDSQTRNRESPGSNPLCNRFEVWAFSFSSRRLSRLSCINEYLAIDSGGNVSDLVVARNCCMTRMLPGEAELVSEWTGLSGRAKSVKRFERSNGLDTALYKNIQQFWYMHMRHYIIKMISANCNTQLSTELMGLPNEKKIVVWINCYCD